MALPLAIEGLLRLIHIGAAILWVGFVWFSAFVWGPTATALPPEAQRQVGPRLVQRLIPWLAWSSTITILAGIGLYANIGYDTGFDAIPMLLNLGVAAAFVMLVIAHALVLPTARKIARTLGGGPPVAPNRMARVQAWTRVNVVLSILVVFAMVMASRL